MNALMRYLQILDACGGQREELQQRDRWALAQAWREVYAARLHSATGKWTWLGYEWHVFSFQHSPACEGRKAVTEYLRQAASRFIVNPEEGRGMGLPAYRITDGQLPRFQGSKLDVLVWPEDLSWTMAFTHEEGDCGPYFSKKAWVDSDGV
jgi:hypothetical protein